MVLCMVVAKKLPEARADNALREDALRRLDGSLLNAGVTDPQSRADILGKLTPPQVLALEIARRRNITFEQAKAIDVVGKHGLTSAQVEGLDRQIARSSWTTEQIAFAVWLAHQKVAETTAYSTVNGNPGIKAETVRLLNEVLPPGSLAEHPKSDLFKLLVDKHDSGEGVSAWMGFGVSRNVPPLPQPFAPIRDWLTLDDWIRTQSFLQRPARALVAIDDYLAPTFNKIDDAQVKAHAMERRAFAEAFNRVYNARLDVALISDIIVDYGPAWEEMRKTVKNFVYKRKQNGSESDFLTLLTEAIPKEFKPSNPVEYGIDEVALTLMLAFYGLVSDGHRTTYPIKFGHPGEHTYDTVAAAIGRMIKMPVLSSDGTPLTNTVMVPNGERTADGKQVLVSREVPVRANITAMWVHLQNPPTFAQPRDGDSVAAHDRVPRSVSYRAGAGCLGLNSSNAEIAALLRDASGNDHPHKFWNSILGKLEGRRYDGNLERGLTMLVAKLRATAQEILDNVKGYD